MKTPIYISASHREPERSCPVCHSRLSGQFCMSMEKHKSAVVPMKLGDVSKCAYCGAMLKLTEFGFLLADPKDVEGMPKMLQRVIHEIPLIPEMKTGKKKPS